MELLRNIFAVIFYMLFFIWIFFKIKNIILINKLKCRENYNEIKKNEKDKKLSKYLFRINLGIVIAFAIYLVIGLIIGILVLFMMFITLGGTAYIDTGADSTFYDNLLQFAGNYFSLFSYILYVLYTIVYMFLVRAIYINFLVNKQLKDKEKSI